MMTNFPTPAELFILAAREAAGRSALQRKDTAFTPGDGVRFRDPWGRERTGRVTRVTSCALVARPDLLTIIRDDGAERVICASRAVRLWNAPANQQANQQTPQTPSPQETRA